MARGDDYKFLQIIDAMVSINQKVNLIGVVIETGIPKKSRGTDWFCTLKIVDESCPSPGLCVNIFAENMGKLPQVERSGDIIQLSQVMMKTHGGEVYALFNKKISSFALFEGKHGTNFVPYQVSSKFKCGDKDRMFVAGLRQWSVNNHIETGADDSSSLKEIKENERFNLVCKILHIYEVTENERMLFVWDGTDAPPVTIRRKPEDEMEDPLPLHLESSPLPRAVLCSFQTVGTILRVVVGSCNEKLGLHVLKTGRWVKLVNIRFEIREGIWRGLLMPSTKLCYLHDDEKPVLRCQRFYDERLNSNLGRMPLTCFPWPSPLTETDYTDVPFVTLMEVLAYPKATAKFKCVVRVLAAFPWCAEDFRSPLGTYRVRLTLEDPTARIHAFVYAEDGVDFFGDSQSVDEMTRKRDMLLGISERNDDGEELEDAPPRNAPWVQCCLKSYYLDKSDIWGSRHYRIFATRLVD